MSEFPRPLSVLVVDDSEDTAWSTAELLAYDGHAVRAALSGEEALRIAAAEPPDVALVDVGLPGIDGCEVARRLAARPGGKPPVLVAVTGYGADGDRARTARAGFHLHLTKPVAPGLLLGLLRRLRKALLPPAELVLAPACATTNTHTPDRN